MYLIYIFIFIDQVELGSLPQFHLHQHQHVDQSVFIQPLPHFSFKRQMSTKVSEGLDHPHFWALLHLSNHFADEHPDVYFIPDWNFLSFRHNIAFKYSTCQKIRYLNCNQSTTTQACQHLQTYATECLRYLSFG